MLGIKGEPRPVFCKRVPSHKECWSTIVDFDMWFLSLRNLHMKRSGASSLFQVNIIRTTSTLLVNRPVIFAFMISHQPHTTVNTGTQNACGRTHRTSRAAGCKITCFLQAQTTGASQMNLMKSIPTAHQVPFLKKIAFPQSPGGSTSSLDSTSPATYTYF